jgi:hypothetical protein
VAADPARGRDGRADHPRRASADINLCCSSIATDFGVLADSSTWQTSLDVFQDSKCTGPVSDVSFAHQPSSICIAVDQTFIHLPFAYAMVRSARGVLCD